MKLQKFTFNPFQENTYIIYDESKEALIIDPGCYDSLEEKELADFIESNGLKPVRLLNTHAHIDHVFGNQFINDKYDLELELHELDFPILEAAALAAQTYGLNYKESPKAGKKLVEGEYIEFGNTKLKIIHVPGHAPGHVVFYDQESAVAQVGDVLFAGSIGRTDFPQGDHATLIRSIKERLLPLGDDVDFIPGHGPMSTLGDERRTNPFLR